MKKKLMGLAMLSLFSLMGCVSEGDPSTGSSARVTIKFDNKVGSQDLKLSDSDSKVFPYVNSMNQEFALTKFGYYITQIELSNGNQPLWRDEINSAAKASEVRGFYQIIEGAAESQNITLAGVEEGSYTHLRFTVGIPEEVVQEGAQGGILDLAEGAWFWNWNSGYIGMVIEGVAPDSQEEGDEFHSDNQISYHIGGWREVEPAEGEMPMLVNNVKQIELELPSLLVVQEGRTPQIHMIVDILKLLEGIDFSENSHIHMPGQGQALAQKFESAFIPHHLHN
jgi:hypothetical protein